MELVSKICPFNGFYRHLLPAVLRIFCCKLAQHHLWMLHKVFIDAVAIQCSAKVNPIRLHEGGPVSFLEEQNVRHYTGIGIPHKSVIWKTDRADQVSPVRQILTY